jgi:hypothetical protein
MSVAWMWGWELAAIKLAYTNSGWVVGTHINAPNYYGYLALGDPHQPAAGYGGGSYCVMMGADLADTRTEVRTPAAGQASVGWHTRFIYSEAYKRVGSTNSNSNSWILYFYGGANPIRLHNTSTNATISSLGMSIYNGAAWVLIGTSITTYNDTSPYKRLVLDIDGPNKNYTLYVDGVAEIEALAFSVEFTGMNQIGWRGGTNGNYPNGGRHDHCVLFDAGNHSDGDCLITTIPSDGETVIIGAQTYMFKSSLSPVANEVLIGASAVLSRENLINAINLGPGSGTLYAATTVLNADVSAEEDLSTTSVHVTAILKGANLTATTDTLAGGDGWGAATITGGDLDATTDKALALGDIYIQGLKPDADVVDGAFLNKNGPNDGTNVDLFANIDDATNLTDFIETTTSPDANEFAHQNRGNVSGTTATATLTTSGAFTDTETATIGSQVYMFSSGPFVDAANNIDASGTEAQTMENLRRAINNDGVAGTNYGTGTARNVDVTAIDTATTVTVTAKEAGTPGNSVAKSETGTNLAWDVGGGGTTLSGGTEDWMPSQVHALQTMQIARASGAITSGRASLDIPSLGKVTSDPVTLTTAGVIATTLRLWGTGNTTTDLDGIKSGFEV